jgi:hypothetical protein
VEDYLARFGHFVESADPIHPTLRESPDLLTQYLAVARHTDIGPAERLLRSRRERTAAETLVRAMGGRRGFVARWMLTIGQSCAAHTDDAVFHLQRVLALVRAAFLEAGRRLARAGVVERTEDVFYLQRDEVWAPAADHASRVARRRQLRDRQKRLAPPPYIPPLSDPAWDADRQWNLLSSLVGATALKRGAQERNGRRVLVGTPGSPGRARGIARLIAAPDEFHRFQPGDVLVAHTTTPIWTPLFNSTSPAPPSPRWAAPSPTPPSWPASSASHWSTEPSTPPATSWTERPSSSMARQASSNHRPRPPRQRPLLCQADEHTRTSPPRGRRRHRTVRERVACGMEGERRRQSGVRDDATQQ